MKEKWIYRLTSLFVMLVCWSLSSMVLACTGFELKAKDGSYVNGRTVEFATPLDLSGIIIPRGYAFTGTLPDGSPGLSYQSKYAVVGAVAFGTPAIMDGFNEKGLTAALFYFPNYAGYADVTPANKSKALAPTELGSWILTQFATVDEVKSAIGSVVVVPTATTGWPEVPPFHYIVYDKSGKSIVIEPINGKLVVSDNPIGVITNSPTFDWHLTNLSNYMNLTPLNAPDKSIDGFKLAQFGQGSGLHGLPGDFSPPSRFVRAAIFSATAAPANNANDAVLLAFHILNQFDIPPGPVQEEANGKIAMDTTIATTVKDPVNLNYYFRTYDDQSIRMISLGTFDLNSKELKGISMKGMQPVTDVSASAKPMKMPIVIPVTTANNN